MRIILSCTNAQAQNKNTRRSAHTTSPKQETTLENQKDYRKRINQAAPTPGSHTHPSNTSEFGQMGEGESIRTAHVRNQLDVLPWNSKNAPAAFPNLWLQSIQHLSLVLQKLVARRCEAHSYMSCCEILPNDGEVISTGMGANMRCIASMARNSAQFPSKDGSPNRAAQVDMEVWKSESRSP